VVKEVMGTLFFREKADASLRIVPLHVIGYGSRRTDVISANQLQLHSIQCRVFIGNKMADRDKHTNTNLSVEIKKDPIECLGLKEQLEFKLQ
jgi:hypothetical protein